MGAGGGPSCWSMLGWPLREQKPLQEAETLPVTCWVGKGLVVMALQGGNTAVTCSWDQRTHRLLAADQTKQVP